MEQKIIRSSRKSLSISVDKNGTLIIRAPYGYPESRINEFLELKREWINKHSLNAQALASERSAKLSAPPEALPFLGRLLIIQHDEPYGYIGGQFHLPPDMPLEKMLPYLRRLYSSIAKETLIPRTKHMAEKMNISISGVKINSAKTRWGSCSSEKTINLSWKLLAADTELIDYVIVHELCHTRYMDHSDRFWAMVASYIPDHKEKRAALKTVQKILTEYGLE